MLRMRRELDARSFPTMPLALDNEGGCGTPPACPRTRRPSPGSRDCVPTSGWTWRLTTIWPRCLPGLSSTSAGSRSLAPRSNSSPCREARRSPPGRWFCPFPIACGCGSTILSWHPSPAKSGRKAVRDPWSGEPSTESILVTGPWAQSRTVWESLDLVAVSGLPEGAVLHGCLFPAAFPYQPDPMRPFVHPAFRGQRFKRYWTASGNLAKEVYYAPNQGSFETVQIYSQPCQGLAIEPSTFGMLYFAGRTVYYTDRREPMPAKLSRAVLTEEPLYGLDLARDTEREDRPVASIRTVAYAGAGQVIQSRFLVEFPDGTVNVLTPEGALLPMSGSAGWRRGAPAGESNVALFNTLAGKGRGPPAVAVRLRGPAVPKVGILKEYEIPATRKSVSEPIRIS